jgi:predicted nucleotidyltransferase
MSEFAPDRILAVLNAHGVRFVLIGGMAAIYYGSRHITTDIDITPEDSLENLELLSSALDELGARVRTQDAPDGLAFAHDGESLRTTEMLNLTTAFGDFDISLVPSGTFGYSDLAREAGDVDVLGVHVRIASLADVIRSKEAAGRAKDLAVLPELREILEARHRRDRGDSR